MTRIRTIIVYWFQGTPDVTHVIPSSSDEELNIDINTDDDEEETEKQIIERRRKQREQLMKVFSHLNSKY